MPLGGGNDTRHLDHLNKSFRLDTHPSTKAHAKTRVSNHDDVIPETVEGSEVDGEGEGDGSDTYHVEDEKWTPWNVLEAVKNRPRYADCDVMHGNGNGGVDKWSEAYGPCGGPKSDVQACCYFGDFCVGDALCYFNHPNPNTSGSYTADCTDSTFEDAACRGQCGDLPTLDIVYNSTTGLWACCYRAGPSGPLDCAKPSKELTFQALAPGDLHASSRVPFPSDSTTSSLSSSSTFTSTSSTRPSSIPSSFRAPTVASATTHSILTSAISAQPISCTTTKHCAASLSGGAKAGIGVGSAFAGIAIRTMLFLFLRHLRRSGPNDSFETTEQKDRPEYMADTSVLQELDAEQQAELDSRVWYEADTSGRGGTHELT